MTRLLAIALLLWPVAGYGEETADVVTPSETAQFDWALPATYDDIRFVDPVGKIQLMIKCNQEERTVCFDFRLDPTFNHCVPQAVIPSAFEVLGCTVEEE